MPVTAGLQRIGRWIVADLQHLYGGTPEVPSQATLRGGQGSIRLRAEDPRRGVRGFRRGGFCRSQGFVSQEVGQGG